MITTSSFFFFFFFFFTNVVEQIIARKVDPTFSFLCLQEPVTGPCPDPDESSLYPPVLFLWDIFYYSSPCMSTCQSTIFRSASPTMSPTSNAICMHHPTTALYLVIQTKQYLVKLLIIHIYLFAPLLHPNPPTPAVPSLIMSGAIPLLPLYANMAWTRTTFPLPLTFILCLYYLMLHILGRVA